MYERTHDVSAVIVQPGWRVFTRDGEDLGEVVAADQQRLVVDHDGQRWQFATDLLSSQEEPEMRATLDASAAQAERLAGT
jgi:hypothetical protein